MSEDDRDCQADRMDRVFSLRPVLARMVVADGFDVACQHLQNLVDEKPGAWAVFQRHGNTYSRPGTMLLEGLELCVLSENWVRGFVAQCSGGLD